jgi:hypothetical protein
MIYLGEQSNPELQLNSSNSGEMTSPGLPSTSLELLGAITAKVVYYREFPADVAPDATHDAAGNRIVIIE